MIRPILTLVFCLCVATAAWADEGTYPFDANNADLSESMPELARQLIEDYEDDNRETYLNNLFRLQIIAGRYPEANQSLQSLRKIRKETDTSRADVAYLQYEIFSKAKLRQAAENLSFEQAFEHEFGIAFGKLDDGTAFYVAGRFVYNLNLARRQLLSALDEHKASTQIALADAIALAREYQPYLVYESILPLADAAIAEDDRKRYAIKDDVLIKTEDGATLSAVVVRPKRVSSPQPAALLFNIYTDLAASLYGAKQAAAHGYVGVVADTRGKRLSPDEITPYEHEVTDTYSVIDWISKQPWSNGKVGMFGGSYNGFAQWAATKRLHPALKTTVPMVAAIPGLGLPMWNNVFTNANYRWTFYVTNNKFLDHEVNRDTERWDAMVDEWYATGRPYREIDQIDGTPNKLLQRWLAHPGYDEYWQSMVPYRSDFARIGIPVLSITGYYDDGQISALHYVKEHYKYNKNADHYLIIGPYDHWGAQGRSARVVRGYTIDPVAHINAQEITFQWLDYVLRDGEKPALLKNKINFQVMGTNEWRHVPSLRETGNETLTLYLSSTKSGDHQDYHQLTETKPSGAGVVRQEVDLGDRTTTNNDYYPDPVISSSLDQSNGLGFISEPFAEPIEVNGTFSGLLKATINKADMDVGVTLFELTPDGTYFYLSHFLGRASYAKDMTTRQLLKPGVVESIPIHRTIMTSRRVEKGSRLVVVLNINKNSGYQINYGTGGDVSDESVDDAKPPLRIEWHNDSYLVIPISR